MSLKKLSPYAQTLRQNQDQLAVDFLPAVKAMAYKLKERLPPNIEVADLMSIGAEELVKLSRRYDESVNDSFWGYAKQRVKGAMLDYLRSLDVVSRADRKLIKDVEHEILVYLNIHEVEPTDDYLAQKLNEDIDRIRDARNAGHYYALMPLDEQTRVFDKETTLETVEKHELIKLIGQVLAQLSEKEQLVMQLYYFEELTFKEISDILSITESRISQIHKSVIGKVRQHLTTVL